MFARLLGARGGEYRARVLCHSWPGDRDAPARFEADSGADVRRFDFGWRPNADGRRTRTAKAMSWLRLLASLSVLLRTAREFRPDLVYSSQQVWDCLCATWLARRLRRPQIIHLHYTIGPWLRTPVLRSLRRCERVVAVSEFIRRDALANGLRPDRVSTLLNALPVATQEPGAGARVRLELGIPTGAPLVLSASRLALDKGHEEAIAAFEAASRQAQNARMLIAGSGPLRDLLDRRIRSAALGNRVRLLGFRTDVSRLLDACDVFIHPSRSDPCPLAVMEASAAGRPVVAWADGGISEIVEDGVTGLLAPLGDLDALSRDLTQLIATPQRAKEMGRAGRTRIEAHFRPEDAGVAFVGLLRGVLVSAETRSAANANET